MGISNGSDDASGWEPCDADGTASAARGLPRRAPSRVKKHALPNSRVWPQPRRRRPVAAAALRRTDQDALSSKDKTCRRILHRGVRARAELKNTCSEQTDISPAAERRRPQRRRRALVAPPQRRLPRGERRRRPPTRVRRGKKETATGAVESGECTKGRGREAALRRRPATYWSRARIPGGGRARALRIDP